MKLPVTLLVIVLLSGCVDALTPSTRVMRDPFDGAVIVSQANVNAAHINEGFHVLGFEWNSNRPNEIIAVAGVIGISNITGLAFNADGRIITARPAGTPTDYGVPGPVRTSTNRFIITLDDFKTIANAQDVKLKIVRLGSYSVSSFGRAPKHKNVVISMKLPGFIEKLRSAGANIR